MALSDSMFLFEIVIEEVKSYVECKEFLIRSQFSDIFSLDLNNSNELVTVSNQSNKEKIKKKSKVKDHPVSLQKTPFLRQTRESIVIANNINMLILNMKKFPIELSLWSKINLGYKMGSTQIPWSHQYIDYLSKLNRKHAPRSVLVSGDYNVFDELTSKRMATVKLSIKLSHLEDRITSQFRYISEKNANWLMNTGFNSKLTAILCTFKECKENRENIETGLIKTTYGGEKRNKKSSKKNKNKIKKILTEVVDSNKETKCKESCSFKSFVNEEVIETVNKAVISENYRKISHVKSDTVTDKTHQKHLKETKSCSSIKHFNALNYIFGDESSYGNKVYCVNYFTVEKGHTSSGGSLKGQSSNNIEEPERQTKVKLCNCGCSSKKETTCSCTQSYCSLDLPKELAHLINIRKCQQIECDAKKHQKTPPLPDDRILLDIHSMQKECCDVTEAVEEVVGGIEAKMKFGEDPCLCSCECRFGFTKKTTYCKVCGGYERTGEEIVDKHGQEPFPCPIYHKLIDKNKLKTWSTSGSDSKKRTEDSQKNLKSASKSPTEKRPIVSEKNAESEKDSKKSKKKVKDDRFKFNYGYQAPHIGHSHCAMPCTGTLGVVPKNMGWLWTAEDIPGLKFRPMWKPGATNKHVVRLLRMAKNPDVVISKKRRKDARLKKRPLKRPLLIIHKKDGEYTVTMETMKTFTKARTFNQYPYEDKPVLTYTIGRTDEENCERQKKKEREQRRLERAQRQFIQSAFRDMCQEICLKTYQQALGILPDAENPECPCYPAHPDADKINLDLSCSCSEEKSYIGSDTDSDEWIVEFTPPNATFDPSFKSKKIIKVDNATQYTYLDYRVKLVNRFGNPVPRYFKGPDGKQQCSDLGGFWSPDHNWLEINIDGYIAPDERWAPNNFIGPSSEQVDAETGKFQATNGKWLVVGVDGYVDGQGKWRFYPKQRAPVPQKKRHLPAVRGKKIDKQHDNTKESEGTWSCFGDASPKYLSKMGIIGHGPDKRLLLSKLKDMLAHGEDVRMPEPSLVPHLPVSKKGKKQHILPPRMKCRHPVPSDKGILAVDADGNKIYFELKHRNNLRPNERIANLTNRGISLSSFHVPCFHSFINTEIMKQQQRERLLAADKRMIVSTQTA